MKPKIPRRPVVLVVDDKQNHLSLLAKVLRDDADVRTARCGRDAVSIIESDVVDVVLCDLRMPDIDGLEVLQACKRLRPGAEFVLMTAYASVPTAIAAMRSGAYDYLVKPFDPEHGLAVVRHALARAAASRPPGTEGTLEVLPGVVAQAKPMLEMAELVHRIADSDARALILGETGTGKERVARAIHQLSERANERFVAVNCAAIPAELMESELFGYTSGAFTGAVRDKRGLFEEADRGTLFLDEIGEMRYSLQAKLSRALEERAIRRLGDSSERSVDVRLIAATHRDIEAMVNDGSFRQDLWYRLNVAVVHVPPLRYRRDDIELLAIYLLRDRLSTRTKKRLSGFTPAALDAMRNYDWPGNVRQLSAAVERATVVATTDRIDVGDLPQEITGATSSWKEAHELASLTWSDATAKGRRDIARQYLEAVLRRHQGNVIQAAEHAGIERESFYRLMRRYGLATDFSEDSGGDDNTE